MYQYHIHICIFFYVLSSIVGKAHTSRNHKNKRWGVSGYHLDHNVEKVLLPFLLNPKLPKSEKNPSLQLSTFFFFKKKRVVPLPLKIYLGHPYLNLNLYIVSSLYKEKRKRELIFFFVFSVLPSSPRLFQRRHRSNDRNIVSNHF